MELHFKASMDRPARVITGIMTTMGVCVFLAVIMSYRMQQISRVNALYPLLLVLALVIAICYAVHPVDYILTDNKLLIRRPLFPVRIHRDSIQRIITPGEDEFRYVMRSFGVGGLFGYFGQFLHRDYGKMTWYATQRRNYMLVVTEEGKNILLTPDDPDLLIRKLLE